MDVNIIFKRRYDKILKNVKNGTPLSIQETIKDIDKSNLLTSDEFKQIFGQDTSDTILNKSRLDYLIVPNNNYFGFQMLILLEDGLFSIPCQPIEEEEEWEIYVGDIQKADAQQIKNTRDFLEKTLEEMANQIEKYSSGLPSHTIDEEYEDINKVKKKSKGIESDNVSSTGYDDSVEI